MNTLGMYELQRGDYVKLRGQWLEFAYKAQDTFASEKWSYYFTTGISTFSEGFEVEAVLRPSVVVRDHLDEYFKYLSSPDYNPERGSCPCQPYLVFEIIHPRKEEAKTDSKQLSKAISDLYSKGEELIQKAIDLEKLMLAKD